MERVNKSPHLRNRAQPGLNLCDFQVQPRDFLASRSMSWLPIGMSLMAALNSGIDYIMQPSWIIIYGLVGG